MKNIAILVCIVSVFMLGMLVGYLPSVINPRPLELVKVDGDEMPGLTDRSRPDTCIAYMDGNKIVHLSYVK